VTHSNFTALGVAEPLRRALAAQNYSEPTPIQTQTIPLILAGSDVLGIAQTGTGKTAAFGLPLLQMLAANRVAPIALSPRALILAPTRELAHPNRGKLARLWTQSETAPCRYRRRGQSEPPGSSLAPKASISWLRRPAACSISSSRKHVRLGFGDGPRHR